MRILPCNHTIFDATASQRKNDIPDNTQYKQETDINDLARPHDLSTPFSQRSRYWAELAARHASWIAGGGFAQEDSALPAGPKLDLQTMPDDPLVRDFYWLSTQVLARMRRPAARRVRKGKQARDSSK